MQMQDLITPIEKMTDEELLDRLRAVRSRRTTERPAGAARAKRAAKKGAVTRINKVDSFTKDLTPAQKAELIKLLGG